MNVTSNYGCVTPHHHTLKVYGTKKLLSKSMDNAKILILEKNRKPKIIDMNYKNTDKTYILNSFIDSLVTNKKIFFQKRYSLFNGHITIYRKINEIKKWEKIKI